MSSPSDEIVKTITRLTAYGQRVNQLFDDWLELTEAALLMLPAHATSAKATGQMAEDTEEVKAIWARMRNKHRRETFDGFAEATGILLQATGKIGDHLRADFFDSYDRGKGPDILGTAYMELCANSWTGQFFTPWSIAKLMANMTIADGAGEVTGRLRQALDRALVEADEPTRSFLAACVLTGAAIPQDGTASLKYFLEYIWPLVSPYYEPVLVNDPACGSGIM